MAATIYLHWTATGYDWIRPGHYHSIITGDGLVHRLHSYSVDLPAHTWQRNSNAVALSCSCMGGTPDPWTQPPTPSQLESLCAETASIARSWGWSVADINITTVMTHAEAASNRDGRSMHDNYGPVIWGGSGERWDLLQLKRNGATDGGEQLRAGIQALMRGKSSAGFTTRADKLEPLLFRGHTLIKARGDDLPVQIDANGTSWALAADLLARYDIPYVWHTSSQRLLVGALDVAPTYRADAIQADVGWELFEMSLQTGNAPVILTGIMRPTSDRPVQTARAWCRVVEFAEEFGVSIAYNPLVLGERRGG
ncbi:MAG: N-acetylmuramoyl-L-alanine amidase [Synechococcus sp. cluster3_bin.96]|nr:N-acetylmuramoyl-L-alanine amidase [Synechococcus sp. cluster3_bin.96]